MILEKPFYPENHISSYRIDWKRFTNLIKMKFLLDWYGIMWEFWQPHLPQQCLPLIGYRNFFAQRSLYMLLGGSDSLFIFGSNTNRPI
jgi:hypothetical protein